MKKPKRLHYAWFVCVGCSLLCFCSSGLAINAFTVYQPYILSLNGLTNAQSSLIIMFRNLSALAALLTIRPYYRRFSLRAGMTVAGGFLIAGLLLFAFSKGLVMYCVSSAVTGLGCGYGYSVPTALVMERWFHEERNTALGICSAFTGFATIGIPSLISRTIERFGLRSAFLLEAAAMTLLILISFLLVRSSPEDVGLSPFGTVREDDREQHSEGLSRGEWLILVPVLVMIGGAMNSAFSHLTVLINGEGYSPATAALVISFTGVSMMAGKIIYGRLCDRLGVYRCNFCFIPVYLAGLVLCCFIRSGRAVLYLAAVLFSFGVSYLSVGLSSWVPELASAQDYDRTIQRFQILYSLGSLIFSPIPGIIADAAGGSYVPVYVMFSVMALIIVSAVQICIARVRKRRLASAD